MELPPLTKQYKREESKIDGPVLEWFLKNYPYSFALEIKTKNGKLLPHQMLALEEVQNGSFGWKIPDLGRRNPFDCFGLKGAHAFKVVCDGRKCKATRIDDYDEFYFRI